MRNILLMLGLITLLTACSSNIKTESYKPESNKDERKDRNGKLTGEGGLTIFGGEKSDASAGAALGVNSFLWRATLDTLSFMPLASADPFGGVIITDWYEDPKTPGERFKVNALILDKTLRADGIKITLFKQKSIKGAWRDQKVGDKLERTLEDTILTRARELKIQSGR